MKLPLQVQEFLNYFMFYQGQFQPEMTVQLALNPTSISLIVLAVLFFALIIISFIKKTPAIVSFLMSIYWCFAFTYH